MQFGLRRAAPFVSYPIHLLKLVYSCHSYCTKKSVSAVLTQYLCMALMQLCCHLANKREIMAAKEKHCRPRKPHFRLPWQDAITTNVSDAMSKTELHPFAKCQPNPLSSFGGDGPKQTDTYTRVVWRGGLVVGCRTCDLGVAGSRPGRDAAA